MKPISSALPQLRMADDTQTGTPPSEHGSAIALSGGTSVQPRAIIERKPAVNLEAALCSLQDCGLSLTYEVTGSRFPASGGWEPVMSLRVKRSEVVDHKQALKIANALEAPARIELIIEWLTMCAALTAQPKEETAGTDLKLRLLSERLQEWPGDIVHDALKDWPVKNKWFPTLSELVAECESRMGNRAQIVSTVKSITWSKT